MPSRLNWAVRGERQEEQEVERRKGDMLTERAETDQENERRTNGWVL